MPQADSREPGGVRKILKRGDSSPGVRKQSFRHSGRICKFLASCVDPFQCRGVRGSPLIRFILLVFALAATGVGLLRVTAARSTGDPTIKAPAVGLEALDSAPFHLVLSAPAAAVEIDTGHLIRPPADPSPISGILQLDPGNPRIGLVVRWKNTAAPGEHRFAKLTLEAPGQETFTHVFDADGDIDDLVELPVK